MIGIGPEEFGPSVSYSLAITQHTLLLVKLYCRSFDAAAGIITFLPVGTHNE